MFVTVDKSAMRVVHAHRERDVCVALVSLELPHVPVAVLSVEYPQDLEQFTDLELGLLYRNCTGQQAPGAYRMHALRATAAAVLALPETDASLPELSAQLATVEDGDRRPYRYVRGSRVPAPVVDLFEPEALRATVTDPAVLQARGAALQGPPAPSPAPTPARPASAQPAARQRPAPSPGTGSGPGARIFAVCDELYAARLASGATPDDAREHARRSCKDDPRLADININTRVGRSRAWALAKV